jgi:DNA-binding transcriptional MerR regulator
MTPTPPTFDPLLWEALPDLNLNIAQTADLCGTSVRQLGYWTRQGYITAQGKGTRRTYGLEAARRFLAIRKAMNSGLSLRQVLRTVADLSHSSVLPIIKLAIICLKACW